MPKSKKFKKKGGKNFRLPGKIQDIPDSLGCEEDGNVYSKNPKDIHGNDLPIPEHEKAINCLIALATIRDEEELVKEHGKGARGDPEKIAQRRARINAKRKKNN